MHHVEGDLGGHRYARSVVLALAVVFLVVPLVELFVLLQVGSVIGVWNTIGLLILMSVLGGWLMKREGLGVVRRIQRAVEAGTVPGRELFDAFLILLGGALMLTPGFVTDVVGMALLVPPVRSVVRRLAARRVTLLASDRLAHRVIDV